MSAPMSREHLDRIRSEWADIGNTTNTRYWAMRRSVIARHVPSLIDEIDRQHDEIEAGYSLVRLLGAAIRFAGDHLRGVDLEPGQRAFFEAAIEAGEGE